MRKRKKTLSGNIAYLQENGLHIPTSAYDDFFASKEGLTYILSHMDLDEATNALVATGWLKGKSDGVLVAMEDLEEDLAIGGIAWHEAAQFPDVQQFEKSAVMAEFLEHVPQNGGIAFGNSYLSFETLAGRILYGFTNKVAGKNQREQMEFCAKMEAVLGIPAQSFMRALLLDSPTRQQERLTGLLASYGMKTSIAEPAQWAMEDDLESFILDGSIAEGQTMRVYWNMQPHGKTISHTGVYLLRDYPNPGEQIGTNPLVEFVSDQMYVDIPYSVLQNYASRNFTYVYKVVTWYEGAPGNEVNWERDMSVPEKKFHVNPNIENIPTPEGSFNFLTATPIEDYEGHLGADYPLPEGTPIVWMGPDAKVIDIATISDSTDKYPNGDSYGTMAVKIEITLPTQTTFFTESENNANSPTLQTDKIQIFFGHIRPSKEFISESDPAERRELGMDDLTYQVDSIIKKGTVIGYVEKHGYEGSSTNTHVHIGAYDANAIQNVWSGAGIDAIDPLRDVYIRPETLSSILGQL